jgi:hypothetical protein
MLLREANMQSIARWATDAVGNLIAFLPNLIAGLVVLLLGYIVALVLAKATRAIASRLGFDRFVARLGLGEPKGEETASRFLGSVVLFFIMVAAIMQAARLWGLTFVADGLARFLAYVPHVVAAAFIFTVALFFGNWVRDRLMRGAAEGEERRLARVLPSAVRIGIIALGSFMALRELQIAPEIVNAAFIFIVAAAAVAAALAFGLGARDTAGRMAQSWYERRRGQV